MQSQLHHQVLKCGSVGGCRQTRSWLNVVTDGAKRRRCRPRHIVRASSLTEQVFQQVDSLSSSKAAGGAGGSTTYEAFLRLEQAWKQLRNAKEGSAAGPAPTFVKVADTPGPNETPEWDVVVCGGTLGVFQAVALAKKGLRVAVVERGPLRGREQEWNISRKEMLELQELGLLSAAEVDASISMEFNPVRVGFNGRGEVWTRDVLNCGVNPDMLIQTMRRKLEEAGGAVLDNTAIDGMTVHPGCVCLDLSKGAGQPGVQLTARLVVDCMGHASPVVRQIRWGRKPDGVCIVVGTLGSGFTNNNTADVIYTHTDLQPNNTPTSKHQMFWEAFPAGSGPTDRTTYMFTYMDAAAWRPDVADLFDDYWRLMPAYQGVQLSDITFKRALFGMFPTYRDSPLKPGFDRIIQIGDACGIQSPLSFGGFGALTRHIARLTTALSEALEADTLDRANLGLIHAYNPGLSSSWMLQRAMSVRQTDNPPADLINRILGDNFKAMEKLGDPVMKPFLQDVIQLGPLLQTMTHQMVNDPGSVPQLLVHVGPVPLLDWMQHVGGLAAFTALHNTLDKPLACLAAAPQLPAAQRFKVNRLREAWKFGAGLDYQL